VSRLDIDDDFKASLREMTPRSRQEIVNDIVRNQQFARAEQIAAQQNEALLQRQERAGEHRADEGDDAAEDSDGDMLDDEEADPMAALFGRGGRRRRGQPHGGDPFAEILLHLLQFGQMRGRGRGGMPPQLLQHLQQLLSQRQLGVEEADLDNMSYEEIIALQDRIGYVSKGLRPQDVPRVTEAFSPQRHSAASEMCVVCQCSLVLEDGDDDDDEVRETQPCCKVVRCQHAFHRACLERWLKDSKLCPLCKCEVL
jgi:hypothetical protein